MMGSFLSNLFSTKGDFIAKEDVTLWLYTNNSDPTSICIKKNKTVQVLDFSTKWWHIRYNRTEGYASKYYFARKNAQDHEKKLWYFSELPRNESIEELMYESNCEGSFLVRYSSNVKRFVLSVKKYDEENMVFKIKHFDILEKEGKYVMSGNLGFDSPCKLIDHLTQNIDAKIELKLGDICQIGNPHSDPAFVHGDKGFDSWIVPISELEYDKNQPLGEGQFGVVYEGVFRRITKVAVKKLKLNGDGEGNKAWHDFLHEKDIMKRLNHPNLVQLYAIVSDAHEGNFLVQEYMSKGDLLKYLQMIKNLKNEPDVIGVSFSKKLEWCLQIIRGMAHLELLTIVHRDLAARNILLDKFFTAKVADFGMALAFEDKHDGDDKIPIRWTAPEALFQNSFSHSSDIWAFGVLMWEIFSYGDLPYGKRVVNSEIRRKMRMDFDRKTNAFRLQKPKSSEQEEVDDVYKMMMKCWDIQPSSRPKFFNLQHDVEHYSLTGDLSGYERPIFEAKRTKSVRSKRSSTAHLKPPPVPRSRSGSRSPSRSRSRSRSRSVSPFSPNQ